MSGAVGALGAHRRPDGSDILSTLQVPQPQHVEGDFYFCTLAPFGANDEAQGDVA